MVVATGLLDLGKGLLGSGQIPFLQGVGQGREGA